jgi:hypothetical protein
MASYASNEVSINWNAPLVFALAGALGQVELFRREVSGLKPRSSQMPKDVSAGQIQAPMPFIERRILCDSQPEGYARERPGRDLPGAHQSPESGRKAQPRPLP